MEIGLDISGGGVQLVLLLSIEDSEGKEKTSDQKVGGRIPPGAN
jgi:hypothetical protein